MCAQLSACETPTSLQYNHTDCSANKSLPPLCSDYRQEQNFFANVTKSMQLQASGTMTNGHSDSDALERAESMPDATQAFLAASFPAGSFPSPTLFGRPTPQTDDAVSRAMDLILRGSHPLHLYPGPDLLPPLNAALESVLATGWAQQSVRLRHKPAGVTAETGAAAKSQPLRLEVFLASLALLPICAPPTWTGSAGRALPVSCHAHACYGTDNCSDTNPLLCMRLWSLIWHQRYAGEMAERLALLTTHVSGRVRQAAHQCQLQLIRGRPAHRNAIVAEMCLLLQKVPWDADAQLSMTEQLLEILQAWRASVARDRELTQEERGQEGAGQLDVAHLEGFGVLLLCAPVPKLRLAGLRLLYDVRDLHRCESVVVQESKAMCQVVYSSMECLQLRERYAQCMVSRVGTVR